MATWTDGAAYAPIERPDGFATPEAEPLPVAEPARAVTPGPVPPPRDFAPTGPAIPLEHLHAAPPARRNPGEPFAVSGAMLTAGSAHRQPGAPRDPREPFVSSATTAVDVLPPPSGEPLAPPTGPPLADGMLAAGTYPPPGEAPMWGPPLAPVGPDSTQRTLVILALVSLLMGVLIPPTAGWMLVVAGLLTLRTPRVTGRMGQWALGCGFTLAVFAAMFSQDAGGWHGVAMFLAAGFAFFGLYKLVTVR